MSDSGILSPVHLVKLHLKPDVFDNVKQTRFLLGLALFFVVCFGTFWYISVYGEKEISFGFYELRVLAVLSVAVEV